LVFSTRPLGSLASVGKANVASITPLDRREVATMIDIVGVPKTEPLYEQMASRLEAMLASLRVKTTSVRVMLADDDGPKGGPAIRCGFTAHVPRRAPIHVEETATTPRLAFDAALATLERQLKESREGRRDGARRPKKYFVAKRLLAPDETSGPVGEAESPDDGASSAAR
jgi:ribosome-associated translation inhibitor RaiA